MTEVKASATATVATATATSKAAPKVFPAPNGTAKAKTTATAAATSKAAPNVAMPKMLTPGKVEPAEGRAEEKAEDLRPSEDIKAECTIPGETGATVRIEDLMPGIWFQEHFSEFEKNLSQWRLAQQAAKKPDKGKGDDDDETEVEELDVFGVQDINDLGNGLPLYIDFSFEDWTLLSLRFELHILTHAFMIDANDPELAGIHKDNVMFYYQRYFKKAFTFKAYGCDNLSDVVELVRDTFSLSKVQMLESLLESDWGDNDIFVKLAEEARRERLSRIGAGDDTAKLKFTQQTFVDASQAFTTAKSKSAQPPVKSSSGHQPPQEQAWGPKGAWQQPWKGGKGGGFAGGKGAKAGWGGWGGWGGWQGGKGWK